jgi:hypothetical protein
MSEFVGVQVSKQQQFAFVPQWHFKILLGQKIVVFQLKKKAECNTCKYMRIKKFKFALICRNIYSQILEYPSFTVLTIIGYIK